jgi:hypothetical protein
METKTCKVPDCNGTGRIRNGMCSACYQWCNANPGKDPVGRPRQKMNPAPADGQCTVVENGGKCTREHRSSGMCNMHLLRKRSNGDPLITRRRPKKTLLGDLMAQATRDTDECTFLTGYESRPSMRIDHHTYTAFRAVWILANGDPGRARVRHACNGGQKCINLRHLYLGDTVQNSAHS